MTYKRRLIRMAITNPMNYRIIFDVQNEMVGGVDVFSVNLAEELMRRGIPVAILLTNSRVSNPYGVPFPEHLPIHRLQVQKQDRWPARWNLMIRYLEEQAPCVYIPNYDYDYSCVSSKLSKQILVAGIVHSDDPVHYEHAMRVGRYWNGIVAVSDAIAAELSSLNPEFSSRLTVIPYGVKVPATRREHSMADPLKIIYCGRLGQEQKRARDLVPVILQIESRRLPFVFTIVGDGPEKPGLQKELQDSIASGKVCFTGMLPNPMVLEQFKDQDVIVLPSDFEGLPISILEAMARGCVPVVTNIRSGIPELIRDGRNGFVVQRGDTSAFAERLSLLYGNAALRQRLSDAAYATIRETYDIGKMATGYLKYFERLKDEVNSGIFKRPRGPINYPSRLTVSWKDHLPTRVRNAAWKAKATAARIAARLRSGKFDGQNGFKSER